MSQFSATASALGYLYQVRFALLVLLNSENDNALLRLEALDDIDLEINGSPAELLQLKHNLKRQANLADKSEDFWKSIRVWSENLNKGLIDDSTILKLITTSKVPDTSILRSFLPKNDMNVVDVENRLLEIAASSKPVNLQKAFAAFTSLTPVQREKLLNAIEILDQTEVITNIPEKIMSLHLHVPREHREHIFSDLEGWWFKRVITLLADPSSSAISKEELITTIWSIQKKYEEDNLPTEIWDEITIPSEDAANQMNFVKQLHAIALNKPLINKAINDYFRAFEQRSSWHRKNLLLVDELDNYEAHLIDEWDRFRLWQKYDNDTDEDGLQTIGQTIFRWVDAAENFRPIRPKVSDPYIVRGSFHILANEDIPRVYWHPQFLNRLQSVLPEPAAFAWAHSLEVRNLLNPAFCALLIREAVKEYQKAYVKGLPYTLLFLILPIILYKPTRDLLPKTKTTKMNQWANNNPSVLIGFPERVVSLRQITKNALSLALTKEVISQSPNEDDATYLATTKKFYKSKEFKSIEQSLDFSEIEEIKRCASFIGRWFSSIPSTATIYQTWGIKPNAD